MSCGQENALKTQMFSRAQPHLGHMRMKPSQVCEAVLEMSSAALSRCVLRWFAFLGQVFDW